MLCGTPSVLIPRACAERLYVCGGNSNETQSPTNMVEYLDVNTQTWHSAANLSIGLGALAAVELSTLYVLGGTSGFPSAGAELSTVEGLAPASAVWSPAVDLTLPVAVYTSASVKVAGRARVPTAFRAGETWSVVVFERQSVHHRRWAAFSDC